MKKHVVCGISLIAMTTAVHAQTESSPAKAEDNQGIADIVVTANRLQENA
ncbi:hypothetical protein [Novosphingobium sp. KN65.2]|nr:hypothetical protein [Novosphingobium sp. KN65.2]